MKAALRAGLTDGNWLDKLPWVMLGLRTAPKEDLRSSSAELVFGQPLRVPGDFIPKSTEPWSASAQRASLLDSARAFAPVPTTQHGVPASRVPTELQTAGYVFIRHDGHMMDPSRSSRQGPRPSGLTWVVSLSVCLSIASNRLTWTLRCPLTWPCHRAGAAPASCPPCHAVDVHPSKPYEPPQLAALRSLLPPAPLDKGIWWTRSRLRPHLLTLPTVGPYALLAAGILSIEVNTGGAGVVTKLLGLCSPLTVRDVVGGNWLWDTGSRGTVYVVALSFYPRTEWLVCCGFSIKTKVIVTLPTSSFSSGTTI